MPLPMIMTMTMPMIINMDDWLFRGREPGGWNLSVLARSPSCGVKVGRLDCVSTVSTATRPRYRQACSELVDSQSVRQAGRQAERQTKGEPVAFSLLFADFSTSPRSQKARPSTCAIPYLTWETDCICPRRFSKVSCPGLSCPVLSSSDKHSWSRHDRSLHTHTHTHFLSPPPSEALNPLQRHPLSQPQRPIRHSLPSIPSRPLPHPNHKVRHETRRDGVRPGEVRRHGTPRHRTAPTCGLRRRSSRHHRTPPNLGKTTQPACLHTIDRQLQGIFNRPSKVVPLARPCTSLDKLFLILAHPASLPTQYGIQRSQSAVPSAPGLFLLGLHMLRSCRAASTHAWVRLSGHNSAAR